MLTTPTCPYCDCGMDLVSKDGQWHICGSCFMQEPRATAKPRHGIRIPEIMDA